MNIETKRQLSVGLVSSLGFVVAYFLISIFLSTSASETINRFIGGLPLFGATYYHVFYNKLLGRPILLLTILPYILSLAGWLINTFIINGRTSSSSFSKAEVTLAYPNPFYAMVPIIIVFVEVTFDFPLSRKLVGGHYQYEDWWLIIYGIVSIFVIQGLTIDCERRAGGRIG